MMNRNSSPREGTSFTRRRAARAFALALGLVLASGAGAAPVDTTTKPGLPATPT